MQNLKDSPEGEGFRPIVVTIIGLIPFSPPVVAGYVIQIGLAVVAISARESGIRRKGYAAFVWLLIADVCATWLILLVLAVNGVGE